MRLKVYSEYPSYLASQAKEKKAPLVSLNLSKEACEVYLLLTYNCIRVEGAL